MIVDSSTHEYTEIYAATDKYRYYGVLNIVDNNDAYISYVFDFEVHRGNTRQKFNYIAHIVISMNSNKNISVYIDTKYDKYDEIYEDLKQIMTELKNTFPEIQI